MTKAAKLYYGNDTYGRNVEMALSVSGQWYGRNYGYNGYGKAWSKWYEMDAPEEDEHGVFWGFNRMYEIEPGRIRLPA